MSDQQTITGSCVLLTVDKAEYDGLKRLETLWQAWKEAGNSRNQEGVWDSGPADDIHRALVALEAWQP